jgi:hypothetical protein
LYFKQHLAKFLVWLSETVSSGSKERHMLLMQKIDFFVPLTLKMSLASFLRISGSLKIRYKGKS